MERDEKGGTKTAESQAELPRQRDDRVEELLAARQEFLQVFRRGAEFTEELMRENERLRYRVGELTDRIAGVENENRDFASRYVEIEQENNNLLNIYIASYQLHSTLDFDEVLTAITEVVLNFIGAEVFVVGMLEKPETVSATRVIIASGCEPEDVPPSNAIVADVLDSGVPYFVGEIDDRPVDLQAPIVCVPLKIKDHPIGFLSIYKFLQHKRRLANVDHELFTLLAGHAATALFAAKLYTDSKRKLSTIQGFIELVTAPTTNDSSKAG